METITIDKILISDYDIPFVDNYYGSRNFDSVAQVTRTGNYLVHYKYYAHGQLMDSESICGVTMFKTLYPHKLQGDQVKVNE